MSEVDYERLLLEDNYDLIIMRKNPWPVSWTRARKVKMLAMLIEYFQRQDEFEKCQILKDIQKDIMNASNNRSKKPKE